MEKKIEKEVTKIIGPMPDMNSLNKMIDELAQEGKEILSANAVVCPGEGYCAFVTYFTEILVEQDSLVAVIPEKLKFLDWIRFRIILVKIKRIATRYEITLDQNFYSQLDRLTGKQGEVIFSRESGSRAQWRIIAR